MCSSWVLIDSSRTKSADEADEHSINPASISCLIESSPNISISEGFKSFLRSPQHEGALKPPQAERQGLGSTILLVCCLGLVRGLPSTCLLSSRSNGPKECKKEILHLSSCPDLVGSCASLGPPDSRGEGHPRFEGGGGGGGVIGIISGE